MTTQVVFSEPATMNNVQLLNKSEVPSVTAPDFDDADKFENDRVMTKDNFTDEKKKRLSSISMEQQ